MDGGAFSRFRESFSDFGKRGRLCDPNGYFRYSHKCKLLWKWLGIFAHWSTWREDISIWPENFTRGRETFPDFGKHYPISENAEDHATHMVISDIAANLRFLGITSKFRRTGRIGRETFPSGRKTLRVAGKRFPDFGKRFSWFLKTLHDMRRKGLFPISPQI